MVANNEQVQASTLDYRSVDLGLLFYISRLLDQAWVAYVVFCCHVVFDAIPSH